MFTPVDFMSVTKAANNISTPETAGSIASNATYSGGSIFTNTTETAGSVAYSGSSSAGTSSGGSSFCAIA